MTIFRFMIAIVLVAGAVLSQNNARAAPDVHCVTNGAQLQQAFADANYAIEGSVEDIRIQAGSLDVDGPLIFDPAGDRDNKDFMLSGGWNVGCGKQTVNPANTLVHMSAGAFGNRQVKLFGDNHSYDVRGIHFDNVSTFQLEEDPCGTFQICPGTDFARVEFNIFSNMAQFLFWTADAQEHTLTNNLFYKFYGGGNLYGLGDLVNIAYSADYGNISFNTFAAMHCATSGPPLFKLGLLHGTTLHHNIFQSDCSHDIYLQSSTPVALYNNIYSQIGGSAPSDSADNLVNVDPGFVDPFNDNYNLRTVAPVSPAIDAGMTLIELVTHFLSMPSQDLDGPVGPRIVGARFDIGAYESPGPAPAGYVVENTNDSGPKSLRQAVYDANHAAGPQKITFNIPGNCPHKIGLLSHLDDVIEDLEIDGFSQPGSKRNTVAVASSAVLCIIVGPASGTLDYAFNVPASAPADMQLQIYGIAFTGGHTSAPLYLHGGSGHLIQGNAFGGVRPGGLDTLGDTNLFHVIVRGAATYTSIGGAGNGDRNYFGSSKSTAILLHDATSHGHIVRNNYIGLDPGGAVPQPIGADGIAIVDSNDIQITGNIIDGALGGISIGGSSATLVTIRGNTIGVDAYGGQGASTANGDGIFIYNGAHFNQIGSYGGKTPSNTIANNRFGGVRIDASAGAENTVRPNSIYNNGKSGNGLGIDLGAIGPLANDLHDTDGDPNGSQNWPHLNASVPNPDTSRTISGKLNSAPNSSFRIDVYRSPSCAGGNRGGDAKTFLVAPTTSGGIDVATDANGVATFSAALNGVGAPAYITAIATNLGTNDTSEIGECFNEDTIFKNGVEVMAL